MSLGEYASLVAPKLEDNEEETGSLASRESMLHNLHYAKQHFSADDFTYV